MTDSGCQNSPLNRQWFVTFRFCNDLAGSLCTPKRSSKFNIASNERATIVNENAQTWSTRVVTMFSFCTDWVGVVGVGGVSVVYCICHRPATTANEDDDDCQFIDSEPNQPSSVADALSIHQVIEFPLERIVIIFFVASTDCRKCCNSMRGRIHFGNTGNTDNKRRGWKWRKLLILWAPTMGQRRMISVRQLEISWVGAFFLLSSYYGNWLVSYWGDLWMEIII